MSWQTPRTDWRASDAYLAADDGRIRGNAAFLRDWANRVCAPMDPAPLGSYGEAAVLTVRAYNAVEQALADVAAQTGPADYARRTFAPGSPVWDDADLRRLEELSAGLHRRLASAQANRPLLDFTLGGVGFDGEL